jgi:hypothetical protein
MRQERVLSVGTDGGGYIILLCTNKDDLSLPAPSSRLTTLAPTPLEATLAVRVIHFSSQNCIQADIHSPSPLPHKNLNVSQGRLWD